MKFSWNIFLDLTVTGIPFFWHMKPYWNKNLIEKIDVLFALNHTGRLKIRWRNDSLYHLYALIQMYYSSARQEDEKNWMLYTEIDNNLAANGTAKISWKFN